MTCSKYVIDCFLEKKVGKITNRKCFYRKEIAIYQQTNKSVKTGNWNVLLSFSTNKTHVRAKDAFRKHIKIEFFKYCGNFTPSLEIIKYAYFGTLLNFFFLRNYLSGTSYVDWILQHYFKKSDFECRMKFF